MLIKYVIIFFAFYGIYMVYLYFNPKVKNCMCGEETWYRKCQAGTSNESKICKDIQATYSALTDTLTDVKDKLGDIFEEVKNAQIPDIPTIPYPPQLQPMIEDNWEYNEISYPKPIPKVNAILEIENPIEEIKDIAEDIKDKLTDFTLFSGKLFGNLGNTIKDEAEKLKVIYENPVVDNLRNPDSIIKELTKIKEEINDILIKIEDIFNNDIKNNITNTAPQFIENSVKDIYNSIADSDALQDILDAINSISEVFDEIGSFFMEIKRNMDKITFK